MTNPAVLRIYSDDHDGAFAADWAAPEKVLPCLARWVEWCAVSNVMPTVWHQVTFSHDTTGPLHQLAAIGLARVVADVESLNRPHLTEAAVRTWSEQPNWHRSLSGVVA
jgi:hypothetical protein